jgi:hypothetical protein
MQDIAVLQEAEPLCDVLLCVGAFKQALLPFTELGKQLVERGHMSWKK